MKYSKSLVACAVGSAVGLGAAAANAEVVAFLDLQDYNLDGSASGFSFVPAPFPDGINGNTFGFKNETGCKNSSTSPICEAVAFDAGVINVKVFATGFNFGGTGIFRPNTTGSMSANITGGAMTWTNLPFGGIFGGQQFFLAPDDVSTVATTVESTACKLGLPGEYNCYGIVATFIGTINNTNSPFHNFTAQWRLEGVAHTIPGSKGVIPIPAAAWLFGSGLIGLAGVARRRKSS